MPRNSDSRKRKFVQILRGVLASIKALGFKGSQVRIPNFIVTFPLIKRFPLDVSYSFKMQLA